MCGIAGIFSVRDPFPNIEKSVKTMCDVMVHRGPDDEGFFSGPQIGLGMRRLSIIDVAHGHQPVSNRDGNLQVILNGEIYNYQPLQKNLKAKGYPFKTNSDTEVIAHQYEQDGPNCVKQFNGMFGFAVWDKKNQSLFLARDRMGIKPLYYHWDGHVLIFASEIKCLLATGLVKKEVNEESLWDYLTLRYVPQPKTIWKNVFKLLPGHTLTLSAKNPTPVIQQYWTIPYHNRIDNPKSFEEYKEEFSNLFEDAVRSHLISDVPVGVLLSGGLDSSAVATGIARVHEHQLNSFSVAFENGGNTNELPYAREVAKQANTKHHEVAISQKQFQDFLPKFTHFADEPLADLASIPLYYVSELARKHVKVVLSGEGSDEILGGYDFNRLVQNWNKRESFQMLPLWLRKTIEGTGSLLNTSLGKRLRKANQSIKESLQTDPINMTNLFGSNDKNNLFKTQLNHRDTMDIFREQYKQVQNYPVLHQVLYVYSQSWLVDNLLMKADRMTMATSIELRVPFLDYRLVEWAAQTPPWVKVKDNVTKHVLKEYMRDKIPSHVLNRPKQGFPVPVYEWMTSSLKPFCFDLLESPNAFIYKWFDRSELSSLLKRATTSGSSQLDRHRLWQFLILEIWCQEWLT